MVDWKKELDDFVKELGQLDRDHEEDLRNKMAVGAEEYGDASWQKLPEELCDDVLEELIDVNGWSVILSYQIKRLKEKLLYLQAMKSLLEKDVSELEEKVG